MSFANPSISDIVATTIQNRSGKIADNVTDNNALLKVLSKRGNVRPFSGGNVILQELSFAENGNVGYYSGYDELPVAAQDVISAAEFAIKQAASPVVISGLEELQNSGKEQIIDLLEGRIQVAEASLANLLANGVYSDGTGSGGKQITGLNAAVPLDPTTGTYGGIDRATWTFWRSQIDNDGAAPTSATIQGIFNALYASQCRGSDHPDLIVLDNATWATYMASLQANQRFMDADTANLGFPTVKFMGSNVVLDGGIGGNCPANTAFFLNTKYLFWRPHSKRNMVPLSPQKRYAVNQDAEVQIIAFAGNLTSNGAQFQGRFDGNA
jgi:hypothetical protein